MLSCLVAKKPKHAIPITPLTKETFERWFNKQSGHVQTWIRDRCFYAKNKEICIRFYLI